MKDVVVKDWITNNEIDDRKQHIFTGGWFNCGRKWNDYICKFDGNVKPYIEAIKMDVVANNYKFSGSIHASKMIPLFSDNTVGLFTWRGWGDLMAAIWSGRAGESYCWIDFYATD